MDSSIFLFKLLPGVLPTKNQPSLPTLLVRKWKCSCLVCPSRQHGCIHPTLKLRYPETNHTLTCTSISCHHSNSSPSKSTVCLDCWPLVESWGHHMAQWISCSWNFHRITLRMQTSLFCLFVCFLPEFPVHRCVTQND